MVKKIVFVCTENANRSQMAAAFGRMYADENVEIYSAGSQPGSAINPKAISAMKELGYDLNQQEPTSIDDLNFEKADFFIGMGCGDHCPHFPAAIREDWQIPDPKFLEENEYRTIRDYIGIKVKDLLSRL